MRPGGFNRCELGGSSLHRSRGAYSWEILHKVFRSGGMPGAWCGLRADFVPGTTKGRIGSAILSSHASFYVQLLVSGGVTLPRAVPAII